MDDFFHKSLKDNSFIKKIEYKDLSGYRNAYIDGKYYFVKYVWNFNELVGEELAKKLNLSTANYEPVNIGEEYAVISPDFKEKGLEYSNLFDLDSANRALICNRKNPPYDKNVREFMDYFHLESDYQNILKLISLDIFMRQRDRGHVNIMVCSRDDFNTCKLAPIYDYSKSFNNNFEPFSLDNPTEVFKEYTSCIENIRIHDTLERHQYPSKNLYDFIEKHPDSLNYFKILMELDILELLKERLSSYDVSLTDTGKYYYEMNQKFSKGIIKKFI